MQHIPPADAQLSLQITVQSGSSRQRVETLRRIGHLFLGNACMFTRSQVAVIGEVLLRLARRRQEGWAVATQPDRSIVQQ